MIASLRRYYPDQVLRVSIYKSNLYLQLNYTYLSACAPLAKYEIYVVYCYILYNLIILVKSTRRHFTCFFSLGI